MDTMDSCESLAEGLEKTKVNFIEPEKALLHQLVQKYIEALERCPPSYNTAHQKKAAWDKLTEEFNAHGLFIARTAKQLKKFWQNYKCRSKRYEGVREPSPQDHTLLAMPVQTLLDEGELTEECEEPSPIVISSVVSGAEALTMSPVGSSDLTIIPEIQREAPMVTFPAFANRELEITPIRPERVKRKAQEDVPSQEPSDCPEDEEEDARLRRKLARLQIAHAREEHGARMELIRRKERLIETKHRCWLMQAKLLEQQLQGAGYTSHGLMNGGM